MRYGFAMFALLVTVSFSSQTLAQGPETRAVQDYTKYCASCHGMTGRGNGPVAAYLTVVPPDLTRLALNNDGVFPRDQIAFIIDGRGDVLAHGPREMPVWGEILSAESTGGPKPGLARARIQGLVDYLASIQAKE